MVFFDALIGLGIFGLPQVLLSVLAASVFVRRLGIRSYSRRVIGLHGALIGGLMTVMLVLGGLSPCWASGDLARRGLPVVLLGGMFALNLFYLLQLALVRICNEPLKPALLPVLLPHLRSLTVVMGPMPGVVVGGIGLLGLAVVAAAWWWAPGILALLAWPPPLLDWSRAQAGWVAGAGLAVVLAGLIGRRCGLGGVWLLAAHYDPLLSFWLWTAESRYGNLAALPADLAAERAYPGPEETARPTRTVIVITIDCWRWDRLSATGYDRPTTPFLEELVAAGVAQPVARTVAVSNASRAGIMGVLASRPIERVHVQAFRLHDVLKSRGYRTHFLLSGDHTVFDNLRAHYGPNVDVFADGLSPGQHSVNDDRRILAAIEELPPADGTPSFFFLHLMSPHEIGVREPEAMRWAGKLGGGRARFSSIVDSPAHASEIYDEGVLQADLHVRRIFAALRAKGYLEDYVGALTADHGQALGEHGLYGHHRALHEPELRIPLFWLDSRGADFGGAAFASQVDVAPTLLDVLGLPVPSSWSGVSLRRHQRTVAGFTSASALPWSTEEPWSGIVVCTPGSCFKYLFRAGPAGHRTEKIHDLLNDPGELHDMSGTIDAAVLERLRAAAAATFPTRFSAA